MFSIFPLRSQSDSPTPIFPGNAAILSLLLLLFLLSVSTNATCQTAPDPDAAKPNPDSTTPPTARQQARVYTGDEPPTCFDTELYRNRQIASYPILQFLGARCSEISQFTATPGLFRYFDAHQHYPSYNRLPLDIYFQPDGAPLEEIYHINTGSAAHHITLPMRYEGTYFVVIRDQVKPSVLIVNSVTLEAEFRLCCALTESIIPPYKN